MMVIVCISISLTETGSMECLVMSSISSTKLKTFKYNSVINSVNKS